MVLAFDSKEYKREIVTVDGRQLSFYTPLGVGIKINDVEELKSQYKETCKEKRIPHAIFDDCSIYSSNNLNKKYGYDRTAAFLESLVYGVSDFIDEVYFSYVILSPKDYPQINVGGHFSPTVPVKIFDFLKNLGPMFSYITAWSYLQGNREVKEEIYIDAFSSKNTLAWEELKKHSPKVFPRGDECNFSISLADAIAFITDRKLNKMKLRLEPSGVEKAWAPFNLNVKINVLNYKQLDYFKWFDFQDIDWKDYQARPILFIDLDAINMKTMVEMEAYNYAVKYISEKGGSLQGFDIHIDSKRIKDNDIFVYAGDEAKKRAETFSHICDLEIYSVKELRQMVIKK